MKGIILAGGTGSRLFPATLATSKQLLPVYDKPMIYYPLSTLMSIGIKEILVITTERDSDSFRELLGSGSHLGLQISYSQQSSPNGIAEALIIGEKFIDGDSVALILGDNIIHGVDFSNLLSSRGGAEGCLVFGYYISDPRPYGVLGFDENGKPNSIEEKPDEPKSRFAIPGLYIFDSRATVKTKHLSPSARGELEVTDLLRDYLLEGSLEVQIWPRGAAWLDTGTFDSLAEATEYVRTIEKRQGLKIACPEEIAWRMGWIQSHSVRLLAKKMRNSGYGQYLIDLLQEDGDKTC
jgi:glucose-1-phosphate thymidylyltransferase